MHALVRDAYERHREDLFRHLSRMTWGHRPEVEDFLDDAFLRLERRRATVDRYARIEDPEERDRVVRSWLFNNVQWRMLDFLKSARVKNERPLPERIDDRLAAPVPYDRLESLEAEEEQRSLERWLQESLDRLASKDRQLVELSYYHHKAHAEIAAILGIETEHAVRQRLYEVRKKLRTWLKGCMGGPR